MKKNNIKPLGKRVIIEEIEMEQMTESGLVIPTQEGKYLKKGRVISVGKDVSIPIKEGDIVFFNNGVYVEDSLYIVNIENLFGKWEEY